MDKNIWNPGSHEGERTANEKETVLFTSEQEAKAIEQAQNAIARGRAEGMAFLNFKSDTPQAVSAATGEAKQPLPVRETQMQPGTGAHRTVAVARTPEGGYLLYKAGQNTPTEPGATAAQNATGLAPQVAGGAGAAQSPVTGAGIITQNNAHTEKLGAAVGTGAGSAGNTAKISTAAKSAVNTPGAPAGAVGHSYVGRAAMQMQNQPGQNKYTGRAAGVAGPTAATYVPQPPAPIVPGTARRGISGILAFFIVVASFAGGLAGGYAAGLAGGKTVFYQAPSHPPVGVSQPAGELGNYADIVSSFYNSVVEVVTEEVWYKGFFKTELNEGAGSGVIFSEDGYIVTNNHVVNGASVIKVTLTNGSTYTASLVGTNPELDIAVIKIKASNLQPVILGTSASLRVGDLALAMGNPLGTLGGTVTNGIISAMDRALEVEGQTMVLMQTNAAVNPGNSGGGLFNRYGELIGIVNAKSVGEDIEGLGFAIPVDIVKPAVEDIILNGGTQSTRPAIGIIAVEINDDETAEQYGVSRFGVYVQEVKEHSGAFGVLEVGDCFVSINGKVITTLADISEVLSGCKIGDEITAQIIRGTETLEVTVVLTPMQ